MAAKEKNVEVFWLFSEAALYFFFYYAQMLVEVEANLWVSSLILWALINISIFTCPCLRKHFKK